MILDNVVSTLFTSCVFLRFFWSILSCSISPVLGNDRIVVSNLACLCFCCCRKQARSSGRSLRRAIKFVILSILVIFSAPAVCWNCNQVKQYLSTIIRIPDHDWWLMFNLNIKCGHFSDNLHCNERSQFLMVFVCYKMMQEIILRWQWAVHIKLAHLTCDRYVKY